MADYPGDVTITAVLDETISDLEEARVKLLQMTVEALTQEIKNQRERIDQLEETVASLSALVGQTARYLADHLGEK